MASWSHGYTQFQGGERRILPHARKNHGHLENSTDDYHRCYLLSAYYMPGSLRLLSQSILASLQSRDYYLCFGANAAEQLRNPTEFTYLTRGRARTRTLAV